MLSATPISTYVHPAVELGQHELQRTAPVTAELLRRAQDLGYDLLTVPITTAHFQSRVLATLQEHVDLFKKSDHKAKLPGPLISPLLPADTDLSPDVGNSSFIAVTSPWIDLGSMSRIRREPVVARPPAYRFRQSFARQTL